MSPEEIVRTCACHRIRMTARTITRVYDEALRPSELTAAQFALLVATSVEDAVSITALAESMDMERSTLTRNLRPLEAQGWVRVGAEGARRARAVEITREGRARLREATTLWQRAHETLRRRLGAEHWAALHAELTRVTQALHGTSVR